MTIISYAQNKEDVILWRLFKNIGSGFYVDIGANDPVIDSVTNLFYLNGWSGINVEPLNEHYNQLKKERPRDKNIKSAISDNTGFLNIWECDVRGWATLDQNVAAEHENNGHVGVWNETPVIKLYDVFNENKDIFTDIHFLKIDVEGYELKVISSNDWREYRPWVVVVEATKPNNPIADFESWEYILNDNDYVFCYFDGLNRFYLAKEHFGKYCDLLKIPPNIFDDYISYEHHKKIKEVEFLSNKLENIEKENSVLERRIIDIYKSSSWRLTAPLRKLSLIMSKGKK